MTQTVWWIPFPVLSPLAHADLPALCTLYQQSSEMRMGWGRTWQNLAEEPFPHSQLDVSLVEAWFEGDGVERAFQRSGWLELCSGGNRVQCWQSCVPCTLPIGKSLYSSAGCALSSIISSPPPPSPRTRLLPGRRNTLHQWSSKCRS